VERQSRDEKTHIVTKDVVGLLLGDVVSTKKCGWLASWRGSKYKNNITSLQKDVVGLQVGNIIVRMIV
jgi:hypothetical protein